MFDLYAYFIFRCTWEALVWCWLSHSYITVKVYYNKLIYGSVSSTISQHRESKGHILFIWISL